MNMNQIFEVNVINNLERECIFVQITSELNHHAMGLYHRVNTSISNKSTKQPINHQQPMSITDNNNLNGGVTSSGIEYLNHRQYIKKEFKEELKNNPCIPLEKNKPLIDNTLNKIPIYPGFVRISPFQSLPLPIVVKDNYIVYITVYVEDLVSNKAICLANQLQMNRQNIEIKRSENGNIIIKETCYTQSHMDNLLYSWSIPQYLCNSMKNNGWDNIGLWHEITESDLIEMGFQRGHRLIFFDKFTDLLRSQNKTDLNLMALYTKYILQSWNLPMYLYNNMVENGWIDPADWSAITDYHFKKMGFKDGHIVKFRKQIKNNYHLIAIQKMKTELESQRKQKNIKSEMKDELIVPLLNNITKKKSNNNVSNSCSSELIFKIDPTTITHEQFWYNLLSEVQPNETYYLETKNGNNPWQQSEEITDTKRRNICELDMNTTYFIRIKCENKRTNKITYSPIAEVKTKDEKWKSIHLPKIPDFTYAVSSNNKQITVEFDAKSLEQIKQTKFDERYSLDIGLSKDNGLERIVNWKNVATLRKDKLVYKYNVNDQKNADWVHVGISSRNDLGQRYNQCTRTRQFPFNQVIKRINTTKHGNNLQFDESMTVATKIDQDYQYSTFAFGQPVTREMCNRYDMYVKVNKLETDCFMGFAPSLESVIDWNQALGYGGNKNSSVGVLANKLSADFAVYNKDEDKRYIYHAAGGTNEKKWDDGSVFLLSFDFLNDDCNIYLNENNDGGNNDHNTLDRNRLLKSIKLNQIKSVVPSFSLNSQGDSIEVVKWRLY